MTTTIIILAVMAALIIGFHVGCEATMRAIRSGGKWRLTYAEQTEIGSPDAAPWLTDAGATLTEVVAGDTVQINWKSFSCPPGTGAVGSYTVSITGATFADGKTSRSFGANDRSAQIVVANLVGQRLTATYLASCDRDSGASPELNLAIVAAPVTPEPPTTEEE